MYFHPDTLVFMEQTKFINAFVLYAALDIHFSTDSNISQ